MKVKIKKEGGAYVITTEKSSFILKLLNESEEIIVIIEERDKEDKLLGTYKISLTLQKVYQLSPIFFAFSSIQEAFEGIQNHLETEHFGINKEENYIILSLYIIGKTINFKALSTNESLKYTEKQIKDIKLNEYEQQIKALFLQMKNLIYVIHTIRHDKDLENKEKEKFFVSINNAIKEGLIKIEEEEEEEDEDEESIRLKASKFSLSKADLLHTISTKKRCCSNLALLKDKRLAVGAENEVLIYNIETYEVELAIKCGLDKVFNIIQLKTGELVTANETIKIWKVEKDKLILLQVLDQHFSSILKLFEMSNGKLISGSSDGNIKVWERSKESEDKFSCIATLREYNDNPHSLIETKNKKYLVSGGRNNLIIFWGAFHFNLKIAIDNVSCSPGDSLIATEKNKLLVLGKGISIINSKTFQIEKRIKLDWNGSSALRINNKYILCGFMIDDSPSLVTVDISSLEITDIKKNTNENKAPTLGLVSLDDSTIASCSSDGTINFWRCSI